MGMRDDVVNETVNSFIDMKDYNPTITDIRLTSNEVGDMMVENECYTQKQWERLRR